jgi:putative transposase
MPRRRIHSPEFKARVALDALCSRTTLAEVAARYDLHPVQVCQWKRQLLKRLPELFRPGDSTTTQIDPVDLNQQLTKLEAENAAQLKELQWLKKKLFRSDQLILRSLLEPGHPCISLRRQCELLGATRSSYYYRPATVTRKDNVVCRQIDQLCWHDPLITQRKLIANLHASGFPLCKNHLHRLLCSLGFAPFERKLAGLLSSRLAQVPSPPWREEDINGDGEQWILDFAYWPSPRGVLFAALLVDAGSQGCLAWGLSDHLSAVLVTDLLRVAMERHSFPLLLRCETFLPYLSAHCLHHMRQVGISLIPPLWLDRLEGSGRATALAPLWRALRQRAESLRTPHSHVEEKWILHQAIRDCKGLVPGQESLIRFGTILPAHSGVDGWKTQAMFNDPSLAV